MATGIKGICYNETTQLNEFNSIRHKHSHLRNFWDETRHFRKLSSTIFDNVIQESLYGCSVPGMPHDIMGGSAKRYSSVITDSSDPGNDSKRRSIQPDDGVGCEKSDPKVVKVQEKQKEEDGNQVPETESNKEQIKDDAIFKDESCPVTPEKKKCTQDTDAKTDETGIKHDMPRHEVIVVEADLSSDKVGQETDLSNGKISAANSVSVDQPCVKVQQRRRSNSEIGVGRPRRNTSQIDITSTPLYKEIYANNLRQYGFLLAKKLGISNQSPKELRASYLQNRQRAELRREQSNSSLDLDDEENGPKHRSERSNSFADFGRRLSQCAVTKERPRSKPGVTTKDEDGAENVVPDNPALPDNPAKEVPIKTCKQRSSTIDIAETTPRRPSLRNERPRRSNTIDTSATSTTTHAPRMRRSNTIESLDRCKEKLLGPIHTRSTSDLTTKYSNSLTNICELFQDGKANKSSRELRRMSCLERRKSSTPSPTSSPLNSSPLATSSETIDQYDDAGVNEACHQRPHSGSFGSDKEINKMEATPVIMRRLKKSHDPHKRLSVPLMSGNNQTNSQQHHTSRRSSSLDKTEANSVMSSLSVPDLYHQSTFGKEQLLDAYCKQEVPRRKLSVDSLRRHKEAKERLERRMSKLKSFDGVLTEADSFIKDIQTRKATAITIPEEPTSE